MKLPAMIICHKNMLHQKKTRGSLECTFSKSLRCSHIAEKLSHAYFTTTAGASSLDGFFVVAKYDVFRNGAVSS